MSKSNELTAAIIKHLKLHGHNAERISPEGRMVKQNRIVSDTFFGVNRTVTSYKRIPSSMTKGTADISATIRGRSVKIEIKIGNDRQSEAQKRYQEKEERAGGTYVIMKTIDQYLEWYSGFIKSLTNING